MDKRTKLATAIALVMHLAGLVGLMFGMEEDFATLTPFNLVAMFALVLYTRPEGSLRKLALFFSIAFSMGLAAEMIGVHTGVLFGNYSYGTALGPKVNGVPFLIGVNWFIVVYASGMLAGWVRVQISRWLPAKVAYSKWFGFSPAFDGALIATIFDVIMEPGATKMGFWTWNEAKVPPLNYLTWFALSLILLQFHGFHKLKQHPFAVILLIIQTLFFLNIAF